MKQPNVYVTPTSDMAIKPRHQHVDTEGKCYLPGLSQWHGKHSALVNVIGELQGVFAVNPPVFAKPKGQKAVQPPTNPFGPSKGPSKLVNNSNYDDTRKDPFAESVKSAVTDKVKQHCNEVAQETVMFMNAQTALGKYSWFVFLKNGFELKMGLVEKGADEISDCIARMREHRRQLAVAIEATKVATKEIDDWIHMQSLKSPNETDAIDVDAIMVPTSVTGAQLLEAVATNKAIEDTIYALNKAMYSDDVQLDCQSFTKEMRKLAGAQFMQLALIRRIHQERTKLKE